MNIITLYAVGIVGIAGFCWNIKQDIKDQQETRRNRLELQELQQRAHLFEEMMQTYNYPENNAD